jgi:uncharacterized membrane protein YfcA
VDFLHTTSHSDLGVFALGLVIAGAVSGLAAGVLGIGGGIVIVPVLYHVMAALGIDAGVRMHVAIATSLTAMIPAALAHVQNAKQPIDWLETGKRAIPLLIGIAAASAIATVANGDVLAAVFAVVAIPVVLHLTFGKPNAIAPSASDSGIGFPAIAVTGFASALTGIAAGTVRRCLLRQPASNNDPQRGNLSVLALITAVAGALALGIAGWNAPDLPPDSLGYVNLLGFALIAPVLLATEPAGAALGHMIDLRRLRLVLAGLVVISTGRMLWDAFT